MREVGGAGAGEGDRSLLRGEQLVDLGGQRLDLGGEIAGEGLRVATADRFDAFSHAVERGEADADLEPRRRDQHEGEDEQRRDEGPAEAGDGGIEGRAVFAYRDAQMARRLGGTDADVANERRERLAGGAGEAEKPRRR